MQDPHSMYHLSRFFRFILFHQTQSLLPHLGRFHGLPRLPQQSQVWPIDKHLPQDLSHMPHYKQMLKWSSLSQRIWSYLLTESLGSSQPSLCLFFNSVFPTLLRTCCTLSTQNYKNKLQILRSYYKPVIILSLSIYTYLTLNNSLRLVMLLFYRWENRRLGELKQVVELRL